MILQSLIHLYDNLVGDGLIEDPSRSEAEIALTLVLGSDGRVVGADVTGEFHKDGRLKGRLHLAPKEPKGRSGRNARARLLCDRPDYTLGQRIKAAENETPAQIEAAEEKARNAQSRFRAEIEALPAHVLADEGIQAVLAFLSDPDLTSFQDLDWWKTLLEKGGLVSFRLDGDVGADRRPRLVFERPAVVEHLRNLYDSGDGASSETGMCLVTGEVGPIAKLHSKIKGVAGTKGVFLVTFNEAAFESYGYKQGMNAPISVQAEQRYSAALEWLLDNQSISIGDMSLVYWSDERTSKIEEQFTGLFGGGEAKEEAADVIPVRDSLLSIITGATPVPKDARFHVLALQGNSARCMVRFYNHASLTDIARNLLAYFDDLSLGDNRLLPLWRISSAIASPGKSAKLPEATIAQIVSAAFNGTAFPAVLLSKAVEQSIRSIHRDEKDRKLHERSRLRIVKAVINRNARRNNKHEEVIPVSLDPTNTNTGYRLGRLFALLERVQSAADPNVASPLQNVFYDVVLQRPNDTFLKLFSLNRHHLKKVRSSKAKLAYYFEQQIGEICSSLSDIPSRLSLEDRGRFLIGYQHQKWTRSEKMEEAANTDIDTNSEEAA